MADNQIEGLPEGATVSPLQANDNSQIEGLPEGATVSPLQHTPPTQHGAGGSWEPEGTAAKVWRVANTPVVPEGRAEKEGHAIAESAPTLAESEHPWLTGAKKFLAGDYADTAAMGRNMLTSPLGAATLGLGELGEIPGAVGKIAKTAGHVAGLGFGAQGAEQAYEGGKDIATEGVNSKNLSKVVAGTGQAILGGAGTLRDTEIGNMDAKKAVTAPVRAAATIAKPAGQVLPRIGGIALLEALGIPHAWLLGGTLGTHILPPEMVENLFERGRTFGLNKDEAKLVHLQDRVNKATQDAKEPAKSYEAHEAGRQQGIPAPEDVLKAHEKAQTNLRDAKIHLEAAQKNYAQQVAQKSAPATPDQAITPEAVAAARPEAPSPTNEELKARQEKLMGQMETAAGVEKPAEPSKMNVRPETFPQEPTAAPRVEETTQPRTLAGGQGVMMGRKPLMLTEGTPEAAPAPEAPKEVPPIMTAGKPERPSMAGLKVDETGKVIDTRAGAQTEAEKALAGGPGTKMVRATEGKAVPPEGPLAKYTPEKPVEAPKAAEAPKAVAPKAEPGLLGTEKEAKNEGRSPEDETRIQDVIKDHSDQELARLGTKYGLDESKYDFSARDENRHRVERDQFVKDLMEKMSDEDKDKLAHLTAEFDNKDSKMWSDAERNALNKAQRARAIMQEFRGGAATVAGGAPVDVRAQVGAHNANGGSTFHPEEGDLKGKPFFAVGGEPEFSSPKLKMTTPGGELTAEQIKEFTERPEVKAALAKHPDASVGTWHDQAADKTVVELVKTPADRAEAIKMGTKNGEKAIYDLKEGKEIPTGGTGKAPEGVYTPGEAESDVEMTRRGASEPEKAKPYKDMTPEEQETLAAKGQSGGSGKLPTGDELIKKYGESDGDPAHTAFILADGRGVAQEGGNIHDQMLGGKTTDANPPRERFINEQGAIRMRSYGAYGDRSFNMSIPKDGITAEQLEHLQKMAPQMRTGQVYVEVADPKNMEQVRNIAYGKTTPEALEQAIRDIAPIKNAKGSPTDEFGNPTVSGASGKFTGKFTDSEGNVKKLRFHEDEGQLPFSAQTLEMLGNENTDWSKQPGNYGEQAKWFSEHPEDLENAKKDINAWLKPQADAGNASAKQTLDLVKKAKSAEPTNYPRSYEDMNKGVKHYKDMTPAEQEALAAKGQSGASGAAAKPAPEKNTMTLPEEAEKYLRPEEKEGVLKSQAQRDKFVQHMTELPSTQEFIDAAQKGEGGRKWYQRSTQAFDAMVKEAPGYFDQPADQQKFTGLLAAGSPQQSVVMNMREALNVWQNYVDSGRPTGKALEKLLSAPKSEGGFTLPGAKVPNAMKALAGEPLWPDISKNKNFKVPSFEANLRGMLDRVTNDGWMGLFSGIDAKGLASPHSYHLISVATRAAADALGWEPAEAQAAIWAFIKTFTEKGVDEPAEIRKYSEDFVDILKNDPETRGILQDMGVNRGELDKRLAAIEGKPKITGRASDTAEDSVRRARERVEKARGKGTIPAPKSGNLFDTEEPDEGTEFNPEQLGKNEPVAEHTYEYHDSGGTMKHVTARDAEGNSVATVLALPEDDDPNTWTVGFSKATETGKGVGLGAYAKLADEANAEAQRSGKTITLQGDKPKQMSDAARRTWVKLGEQQGFDVQWSKDNRPSITFRPSKMNPVASKMNR